MLLLIIVFIHVTADHTLVYMLLLIIVFIHVTADHTLVHLLLLFLFRYKNP